MTINTSTLAGTLSKISISASNSGSVLPTGIIGRVIAPMTGIIQSATLMADQTGSLVMDIWKLPFVSYPPTNLNSICASDLPTLSSAIVEQDTTLTGWTTQINAGDVLFFNINSVSVIQMINCTLLLKLS